MPGESGTQGTPKADSEVVGALEAAAAYSLKVAVLKIDEGKKHIVATS